MLTREQAIEAIERVMAEQYSAEGISFRDVMVRNRQVSLTVLEASAAQHSALEASLREALAPLGAETVHCRFRSAEGAPSAAPGGDAPA
ncbi:putative ATP-binding protein, partial [Paenibacillus agaridevorans]